MSMLAENRKKSKYSINPRGTYWSKDDDKFGQKLMEKFGWQKGKGLGANEDGRVENVKASSKNDSKGFGFKKTNNDNWISHQDDFNCLLSELNANHGRKESEEEKIISLEEKSKAAKKRVHYHKQAKGKDLSQRSTDELDCIFGRKKSKIPKEEKEILQSQETEATCEENMHGIQTIQSNQSVQEYFAMKLAQMKAKKNSARQREKEEEKEVDDDDDEEDDDDDEDDGVKATVLPGKDEMEQDETGEVPASEETSEEIPKAMDSNEEEEEEEEEVVVVEKKERVGGEKIKKKKKKKSKDKEKARLTEEDEKKGEVTCTAGSSFGLAGVENGQDEAYHSYEILSSKKSKKSKRKKRSKESSTVAEAGEMKESVMEEVHPAEVSKMESGENGLATKTKKKKRDKKLKDETLEQEMNAAEAEEQDRPLFSDRAAHKPISETESEQVLEVISDEASVPMNEQVVVTGHKAVTVQRPKKSKKNKRLKDEAVEHAAIGQDVLDKSADFDVDASINTSSSSRGSKGDNNDEETIASPPKKKKKKKSSKKSKSEVEDVEGEDEDEDDTASTLATTAADSSAGDKRTDSLIIQKHTLGESRKLGPSPVLANSISLNTSVLVPKTPKEGIPENKHGIKRSPFAVSTATKIFQKAGANVDKICGYGNNLQ